MKTRMLSIIAMMVIAIPLLIIGGTGFTIFVSAIALLALKEIIAAKEQKKPIPFFVKLMSYLSLIFFMYGQANSDILNYAINYEIVTITLIFLLLPLIMYFKKNKYDIEDSLYLIGFVILIGISFGLIVLIRNYNLMYLLYLLIIGAASDTYAYLMGKLIGRKKLCKEISPNKTVEGTIAGIIFGTLFGTIFYFMVINNTSNLINITAITMLFAIISQLGDLCFSSVKRKYNIKDFSNLIPGHGGILDRLDSFVFLVLIFSLFINII